MAQSQEVESKGAMVSQTETPASEEPPELEVEGSGKALPTKMAPDRERVLATTYSHPPPPDYAQDGKHARSGLDSGLNPHGRVHKTATDCG